MMDAPPAQRSSANAVDPRGRSARTSSPSPPTKAQTSPGSRPIDDGDDDRPDQHEVWLSVTDAKIRSYGQFEQGRHCRTDGGEQQGH